MSLSKLHSTPPPAIISSPLPLPLPPRKRTYPSGHHPCPKRPCLDKHSLNHILDDDRTPPPSPPLVQTIPMVQTPMFAQPTQPAQPAQSAQPAQPAPDKFSKSRAIGQTHRDNELAHLDELQREIEEGRAENLLLFTMSVQRYTNKWKTYVHSNRAIFSHFFDNCFEDHGVTRKAMALSLGLYKVSTETRERIGVQYISAEMAAVYLELHAYRRNLVPDGVPGARRRRGKRTSYREATSVYQAELVVAFAERVFWACAQRGNDHLGFAFVKRVVDLKMEALGVLFRRFDDMEWCFMPADLVTQDSEFLPGSPTGTQMAQFDSPRRRREIAKRCSRCQKLKVSGSGHGRSKCDDGFSISSPVPYAQSIAASSDGSASSTRMYCS